MVKNCSNKRDVIYEWPISSLVVGQVYFPAHLFFVQSNPCQLETGDLNTGLVWYSNGQKLSDRRMVRYSNAI